MMQALPRKSIILALSLLAITIVLFKFYGDVPADYYRNYAPGETIVPIKLNNDTPQPGYFKTQPEWNWDIPDYASSWSGYARKPKNRDIVVLTASDGGGHNSAIPNVLQRVLEDREKYCEKHGYTHMWLNTSRYDIGEAHRTWSKIPAVAEAFHLHPTAEWVWLMDTDIIIMAPDYDLVNEIVGPDAIKRGLMRDTPILDGEHKDDPAHNHIKTPKDFRVEDIDVLITQDHQSMNTGSTFFRRSAFTRMLLETMTDSRLMGLDHGNAEQDAIAHLALEHPLVRDHIGIYPQRKFNAYVKGGNNMGYRDGDLLVHLAGCWTGNKCAEWFEEYSGKKGHKDVWKPEEN